MKKLSCAEGEGAAVRKWAEDSLWAEREYYEMDREYVACVRDIVEHPVFQLMEQYIQHGSTTCRIHCIKVSYLAYRICGKFGWDQVQAARAGLLHDLFLYDWHTHAKETGKHFHGFTHPRTALDNAVLHFQLTEKEKDIILCHMWPLTVVPPKSPEGIAVCYADKVCGLAETVSGIREKVTFAFRIRGRKVT